MAALERGRGSLVAAVSSRTMPRRWRTAARSALALEPGVLCPLAIGAIAEAGPRSVDELARVDGIRRWRVETFGQELVAALESP